MYQQRAKSLQNLNLAYQPALQLVQHYIENAGIAEQLKEKRQQLLFNNEKLIFNQHDELSPLFSTEAGRISLLCEELEHIKCGGEQIDLSDVRFISREIGTLEDVFCHNSFTLNHFPVSFWNYNYRALFCVYLEVHQSMKGKIALVVRELDTLYPVERVKSLHKKHLRQVILYLVSSAKKINDIDSISFERIENTQLAGATNSISSFMKSLGATDGNLISLASPSSAYHRAVLSFAF